jgi:uncharacterized protein with PIN domain
MRCNGILVSVPKESVLDRLPPRVRERHDDFRRCGSCGRVYWAGTHHQRMQQFLGHLLADLSRGRAT